MLQFAGVCVWCGSKTGNVWWAESKSGLSVPSHEYSRYPTAAAMVMEKHLASCVKYTCFQGKQSINGTSMITNHTSEYCCTRTRIEYILY